MSYAQKMSHSDVIAVGMFQDVYQVCASFRRVHFFIFCSTRAYIRPYLISNHINTQFILPWSDPFLPRLPDAERDSGAG